MGLDVSVISTKFNAVKVKMVTCVKFFQCSMCTSRYLGRKKLVESAESRVQDSRFLVWAGYSYWTLGYILSENGARKLVTAMPLEKLIPVDEYLPILSNVHPRYVN